MANYKELIPHILTWEGGFADIPEDKGGATMRGITIGTFRQFYGQDKSVSELKAITDEQWSHIFKVGYWDKFKADNIDSQSVANACVDWAWHSGAKTVVMKVQRMLGVRVDGIVGSRTLAAINSRNPRELFHEIQAARKRFVEGIVRRNPNQRKFLKGWMNRICEIQYTEHGGAE